MKHLIVAVMLLELCLSGAVVHAAEPDASKPPQEVDPRVFRLPLRKQGDDGVHTYRIPGLATSKAGTLIAVFDIRHAGGGDLPADIDVGMMRSTDNGRNWSPMKAILDYDKSESGSRGNGVGDPCVLVDQQTGDIFVAALWSKGDRGWRGSGPGMSPAETGQFVITKSADDGLTWSKPESITPQVKDPKWTLCFQGPGSGIQLKDGALVMPAQFKDEKKVPHSCFVASVDHGATWKISPPATPSTQPTSESQIVQLDDGALLLSMRNEKKAGERVWARWEWNGDVMKGKWSDLWLTVTDPTCMASIIHHPNGPLLFSNPNNPRKRAAMTVRASVDSGKTWSDGKLLNPAFSAYSCMSVLRDGSVGILYETVDARGAGQLEFASFPLEWVMEKK